MTTVFYPGSFDPIHKGHVDIVETAARLFDGVVVAAVRNPQKGAMMFDLDEREELIGDSLAHLGNVKVSSFAGLVVDAAREVGADFVVKGLRTAADFEVEQQMAQTNRAVSGVDTLFIPATGSRAFVSSRYIREIARCGGDVGSMVPEPVDRRLRDRFADEYEEHNP